MYGAIDTTPIGLQTHWSASRRDREVQTGLSYRLKSNLGLSIVLRVTAFVPSVGAGIDLQSDSETMLCGTKYKVAMFRVNLLLISVAIAVAITHGKRNEELVARVLAAKKAFDEAGPEPVNFAAPPQDDGFDEFRDRY